MALFSSKSDPSRPSIGSLVREAKAAANPEQAAEYLVHAAVVADEQDKPKKAISLLHEALERLPLHQGAHEHLIGLLERRGRLPELFHEHERRLSALTVAWSEGPLLSSERIRIAALAERLGKNEESLDHYLKAFTLDPERADAARAARILAERLQRWDKACDVIEREIATTESPRRRAQLLAEQGVIHRERLGDVDRATSLLRAAADCDPANALVRLELARSLGARSKRASNANAVGDREEAAELYCSVLPDAPPNDRVSHLEAALELAPDHETALALLEEFDASPKTLLHRWGRYVAAAPASPLAIKLRARIAAGHLELGAPAAALPWLEAMVEDGATGEAIRVAEIYAASGDANAANRWAERGVAALDNGDRIDGYRRLVAAFAGVDSTSVFRYGRALLALEPYDADTLETCLNEAGANGSWREVADMLGDLVDRPDLLIEARAAHLERLAKIREEHLADVDGALQAWQELALIEPSYQGEAQKEQARLAEASASWDKLAELLEADSSAAPNPDAARGSLRQLYEIHRYRRNDPAGAVRALLRLMPLEHEPRSLLTDLVSTLREAGPDSPAVDSATAAAETAAGNARTRLFRLLGRLHDGWNQPEPAFRAWSHVRRVLPNDEEALQRSSTLAESLGRYELAVRLLQRRSESTSGSTRVALQRKVAELARVHLSDHDEASQALVHAFEEAPSSLPLATELAEELERAGRFSELTTALQFIADLAEDPHARMRALVRMAQNYETELDDAPRALGVWRTIVGETEDLRTLSEFAADARRDQAWERLELLLERLIEQGPDEDQRIEWFLERVDVLAEHLVEPHNAMRLLKGCLANQEPPDRRVLSRLVDLAEEAEDHPTLARALEALLPRLDAPSEKSTRVRALETLANLYEGRLRRPRAAVRVLERWEDDAPNSAEPTRRLLPYRAERADWEGFLAGIDRVLEMEPTTREATISQAWSAVRPAGDTAGEAETAADDSDTETSANLGWMALELAERAAHGRQKVELLTAATDWFTLARRPELAFASVTEALRAGGPNQTLLTKAEAFASELEAGVALDGIYEEMLERAGPDDTGRLAIRHATVVESTQPGLAFDRLRRALDSPPTDDSVLDLLDRVAEASGRTGELVDLYAEWSERLPPGDAATGLMERALLSSELSEERAHALIRQAVPLAGAAPERFSRIERCASRLGASAERVLATAYEAAASDDSANAADILRRGAHWYDVKLDDLDAAYRCMRKALLLRPDNESLLEGLEEVAARCDYLRLFDTLLSELIEAADSETAAAPLVRRRAQLLHHHLRDPSQAADLYMQYAKQAPDDLTIAGALRGCLLASDRPDDLIRVVEAELERSSDAEDEQRLLREIATLAEERVKDPARALQAWKQYLETSPSDATAQSAVARLSGSALRSLHENADYSPEVDGAGAGAGAGGGADPPPEEGSK